MRFFIGAIVSTLILSPVSVLSMAGDSTLTNALAQVNDGMAQQEVAVAGGSTESSTSNLGKRFCVGRCREKSSSRSGFQCKKRFFSMQRVKRAKNAACLEIKKNKQRGPFPSLYTASDYQFPGPYFEWPIKRNGRFFRQTSRTRYRIILTKKCRVVGAVIRNRDKSYTQCEKLNLDEDDDEE